VLRPDLESAVAAAYRWARPDGVLLLSPTAPSFGQFRDYRDRGETSARATHAISSTTQPTGTARRTQLPSHPTH